MATAYLDASNDVLALCLAAVAPSLVDYQKRTTEATQVIAGVPDSLVGKFCVGRDGNGYSYHRHTSGDGTLLANYTLIEDVAALAAVRVTEVDAKTAELIASVSDLHDGVVLKAQIDAAVDLAAIDAIVDTRTVAGEAPIISQTALYDHGNVNGSVVIDLTRSQDQRMVLTGSLGANDISVLIPSYPCKMTLEIVQSGAGAFAIAATAWNGGANAVDFGAIGAPTYGDAAGAKRFLVFHFNGGSSTVYAHDYPNVF